MSSSRRGVARTRIRVVDTFSEAVAGLLQRPGRTALTALGTILGVGAFVCVLGLTASANGQVDKRFDALEATTVTVEQATVDPQDPRLELPLSSDARVGRIRGVEAAGMYWDLGVSHRVSQFAPAVAAQEPEPGLTPVMAVSPGMWAVAESRVREGRVFDQFHDRRASRVAVIGASVAERLNISRLDRGVAVFIDGVAFLVVGIIDTTERASELLLSVAVPARTALKYWGPPVESTPRMLISTDVGAAQVVADQTAVAMRPDHPEALRVIPPPDPGALKDRVTADLDNLFLMLAGVCLVIGAVGIANTTLVSVLERVPEVGLRRTLGARPSHVAFQFLLESTITGGLGGLAGTALGLLVVLVTAVAREWTAIVEPWTVGAAPLAGALTGLLAGVYPAIRAGRIEPVDALQR